jgi:hypothetical protein
MVTILKVSSATMTPPNVYACVMTLIKVDGARLTRPLTQYKLRLASR